MKKHLTATTAADLLAFFPHTLGFDPRESFGFITVQGGKTGATLRTDVPDDFVSPSDYAQRVTHYLLVDEAADGVLMFVYTNESATDPAEGAKPYSEYARAIRAEVERAGLNLLDGWLITDAGWTTYFCEDPACCQLQPMDEIRDSVVSAEMVFAGSAKRTELAADPAFVGNDDTARRIRDSADRYPIIDGMDFAHPAMCEARRAWHEALGTTPGETEAVELLGTLQRKPLRDRILVDAISANEDPATYRQVMLGQFQGQPDWSRVEAMEDLLTHLLTYAPGEARTPVFCFLSWLNWYKGRASTALAYIAKGLEADPEHRLALLLLELLHLGKLPEVALKPSTAYKATFRR